MVNIFKVLFNRSERGAHKKRRVHVPTSCTEFIKPSSYTFEKVASFDACPPPPAELDEPRDESASVPPAAARATVFESIVDRTGGIFLDHPSMYLLWKSNNVACYSPHLSTCTRGFANNSRAERSKIYRRHVLTMKANATRGIRYA